jgi:hypothetical protein
MLQLLQLLILLLLLAALASGDESSMKVPPKDAHIAAEVSRKIRQHFRDSGMNWISPVMLHEVIDKDVNTKPFVFVFADTTRCEIPRPLRCLPIHPLLNPSCCS